MKFRTFRICIRKGWYYIICSVSLLLLSAISSTAKASVVPVSSIQTNTGDTIPDKKSYAETDTIKQSDTLSVHDLMKEDTVTNAMVDRYDFPIEDFVSLTDSDVEEFPCAYGPPLVIYKYRPIKRFIEWIKYRISIRTVSQE